MYLMGLSQHLFWRKGWDSNPRTGSSPITRFRVERVTASSLPFHKRVFYTNCRRRASLFYRGNMPAPSLAAKACIRGRSGISLEEIARFSLANSFRTKCLAVHCFQKMTLRKEVLPDRSPFPVCRQKNAFSEAAHGFQQGRMPRSITEPAGPLLPETGSAQRGRPLLSSMSA